MRRLLILETKHKTVINSLLAIAIVLLVASCNFFEGAYPPPEPPPQTEILRIEILPNDTLAPGDTATFRCIIADSLDSRFVFTWSIDKTETDELVRTDTNSIRWVAPEDTKSYTYNVTTDNGSEDSTSVSEQFKVFITE